jgi:predicted MFS family arabinose efflux permease
MCTLSRAPHDKQQATKLTRGLITLFAFSCGAIVANLYYAQPITELIGPSLQMSSGSASLIVSLTQVNALYMTSIFVGGAIGSALAGALYERGGWTLVASVALAFPLIAFIHFLRVGRLPRPSNT